MVKPMAHMTITPDVVFETLARIPEGYIHRRNFVRRYHNKARSDEAVQRAYELDKIGRVGHFVFDKTRMDEDRTLRIAAWAHPSLPHIQEDGKFLVATIHDRMKARARQFSLADNPAYAHIFNLLEQHDGFLPPQALADHAHDQPIIDNLIHAGGLAALNGYVYDPLRLSLDTIEQISNPLIASMPAIEAVHEADSDELLIPAVIDVTPDSAWDEALQQTGDVVRPDAREGNSQRMRVLARSYIIPAAAKRLELSESTLEAAFHEGKLSPFTDPDGENRLRAADIEHIETDADAYEQIAAYQVMKIRDVAIVTGSNYPNTRKRLARAGISRSTPTWGDVRGRWGMPSTLREFRAMLQAHADTWRADRDARIAEQERILQEQRRLLNEQRDNERRRRSELRAKLVAAFPAWRHEGRADQRIIVHVGPPNSGKTHQALISLAQAENGWYLAPLRLLAFEIFDRLNRQGVLCNLLTGEEFINIPGATITAATIEMFDPRKSGDVVVIDEAQMLADPDRGWAWTRAIMEAQAPEIRVICPPTARTLIEQMASAAAIPYEIVKHERLAPIEVAEKSWSLEKMPPRTILVAFSRQNVLHLKNELERMKRTVSVIYGALPPEVRRKQADRFANGQTDICVATDAVGMGLNLPADYVCFYELEKFDGRKVRSLTSSEVQQIGGRAGRYGLSTVGEVGAMNKRDLKLVNSLFHAPQIVLTHARVAPSVADLEMIPGSLGDKLEQWSSLQSVPESLKSAIKTADLSERIELARMLSDDEIESLGLESAMKLINAPTRQSTRLYWHRCARAILSRRPMPLPDAAPEQVNSSHDLEVTETCVAAADIYLWLSCREEFEVYAPDADQVREDRTDWSERIDDGLRRRLDTARRCRECGKPLPMNFRYSICNDCHFRTMEPEPDDLEYTDLP